MARKIREKSKSLRFWRSRVDILETLYRVSTDSSDRLTSNCFLDLGWKWMARPNRVVGGRIEDTFKKC